MKIRPIVPRGQTDRNSEAIIRFSQLRENAKKIHGEILQMYPPRVRDPALRLTKEREPYLPN